MAGDLICHIDIHQNLCWWKPAIILMVIDCHTKEHFTKGGRGIWQMHRHTCTYLLDVLPELVHLKHGHTETKCRNTWITRIWRLLKRTRHWGAISLSFLRVKRADKELTKITYIVRNISLLGQDLEISSKHTFIITFSEDSQQWRWQAHVVFNSMWNDNVFFFLMPPTSDLEGQDCWKWRCWLGNAA